MIRGMYSAAGMLTAARRMEFVTNNLANAQTVGYKQERTATTTFAQQLLMEQLGPNATPGIGTLSTATVAEEPLLDFTQGSLQETGRSLDVASRDRASSRSRATPASATRATAASPATPRAA